MIIVKLMGGLGNQMFEYAFGRYLAIKNDTQLKLDISQLKSREIRMEHTVREFALDAFNIPSAIAGPEELKRYDKGKFQKVLDLLMLFIPLKRKGLFIREPYFRFFKKALNTPEESYLDGYWQSEKYFLPVRETLLKDFSLKIPLDSSNKNIAEQIKMERSVSIHVRRGDYLSIAQNTSLFEICDAAYYVSALNEISKTEKNIVLYVFSDEPEWFNQNVKTNFPVVYVTHNSGTQSYIDMYLMSLCKHNIIANSSFSWWGAWLNENSNKIVVTPKRWFRNNSKDTGDLIPKEWIKL